MSKPAFVYVTYIASSPKKVWSALLDREMTKQYWDHFNVSDWKVGSRWEHQRCDSGKVDLVGTVIECSPPHRLVLTWALPHEIEEGAKVSRVTFEIEPYEINMVRLTVLHQELEAGSKMEQGIKQGWPMVLSGLKTLLETGTALPMFPKHS